MFMLTKLVLFLGLVEIGLSKKCSSDFECPSIQKCLSGACHEEYQPEACVARSDCLKSLYGYGCVQGRCGCVSTNQDCPAGNFCTKKRCLLTGKYCNNDQQCQGSNKGHRCTQGQCSCLTNMDCNGNYKCVDKLCAMDKAKMKDPMGHHMERMGHPSFHEEKMGPGYEAKYGGANGKYGPPTNDIEGMHQHHEF